MSSRLSGKSPAYFYLILTTSIWGSLYIATRIILETVPPVTVVFLRYLCASLLLIALVLLRWRKTGKAPRVEKRDWPSFLLIGFLGYFLSVGAQNFGTKFAGVSVASLINAMNPVTITLFAAVFLKEKLSLSKVVALVLALSGAIVILGGSGSVSASWGILFSLLSVVLWSLSSIAVRGLSRKYDPLLITTVAILIALASSAPAAAVELATVPHGELFSVTNLLCILYLGFIATAVPNLLWNRSLSMLEASTCSLFYPVQPLVSVGLGALLLGERVDLRFAFGSALIVIGILVSILGPKWRR